MESLKKLANTWWKKLIVGVLLVGGAAGLAPYAPNVATAARDTGLQMLDTLYGDVSRTTPF